MKVYISGKITGDENYKTKFSKIEEEILSYGYTVFNPAVLPAGFDYEDYMDIDLLALSRCDAIFLLKDWESSPGARRELEEAKALGLQIMNEDSLRIRRTLKQISSDTIELLEKQPEEESDWKEGLLALSNKVLEEIQRFDLSLDEFTNLELIYDNLDEASKKMFINDFLSDSDKLIEYDLIEKLEKNDQEGILSLTQIYETAMELILRMDARKAELKSA
ncbi:MAG: DUF4406 domain-containing protein [Treponema sp.]|nr:DUF4406 domain-containing protein [Treponema sp.]